MIDEFTSTTEYVAYKAGCPVCGEVAEWNGWCEQNPAARDRSLYLRVDCQWCALSELVAT